MIDKNEVRDMLIEGKTTKEISERIGCSDRQIRRIIKNNDWSKIPKGKTSKIVKMLKKGCSVNDIINKIDITERAVYYIRNNSKYTDIEDTAPTKSRKNARKTIKKKTMGKWTEDAFNYIQRKCLKEGTRGKWDAGLKDDIEGHLTTLMMYVDSLPDVKNKIAYLKTSCKNEIINFLEKRKKYDDTHESLFKKRIRGNFQSIYEERFESRSAENTPADDFMIIKEQMFEDRHPMTFFVEV